MGLFDEIKCHYPLPVEGFKDHVFQTKDTPAQYMDRYEIRADGSLWHEEYDTENHSDAAKWEHEHPGKKAPKDLDPFCGCMARVNKHWVQCDMTGEIRFYSLLGDPNKKHGWIEFSSYFLKGQIQQINLVEYEKIEQ